MSTSGNHLPNAPRKGSLFCLPIDSRDHQPRFRRVAERIRRSKDDPRAPRPPHPPLRHHRDRQRELAFQGPRLTSKKRPLNNPRSPRLRNPDQLRRGERYRQRTSPSGDQSWTPISGQNWTPIDRITGNTGKPSRLDTAMRMAREADSSARSEAAGQRHDRQADLSQIDELTRILGEQGEESKRREVARPFPRRSARPRDKR